MPDNQLQQRISIQIITGYGSLILLTILLYAFSGIIDDELISILTTLSAISALYVAPLFQFFSEGLKRVEKTVINAEISNTFSVKLIKLIIPAHFVIVGGLIFIKSLNILSFKEMNLFLGFIETTFGAYMGYIITSLFKLKEK